MDEINYIYNKKSLKEQFRIFYNTNNPKDFVTALEFFTIFGGLNRQIDTTDDMENQITIHILRRYRYLRNDIAMISKGDELSHKILSSLALGDRRTNSAFKKTKISFDKGIDIVDDLCDFGMLKLEKSFQKLTNKPYDNSISEKLIFTTSFSHYWFACVSPIFKSIRDGDFNESLLRFRNKKVELFSFIFEQLCHEVIKQKFTHDKIKHLGRYWDNSSNILDILGKTSSGKIIAGTIKYTNNKIKKSQLTNLKNICNELGIDVDIFILISKSGWTKELKSLKNDSLQLYTIKDLSSLL